MYWTISVAIMQLLNISIAHYMGNVSNSRFAFLCFGIWLLCLCFFLAIVNPSHRRSFFDTQTGQQYTVSKFTRRGIIPEEETIDLFSVTRSHWAHMPDVKDGIQQWLVDNWLQWETRRPPWFDASFVDHMWKDHRDVLPIDVVDVLTEAQDSIVKKKKERTRTVKEKGEK